MSGDPTVIAANYSQINTVSDALHRGHVELDQLTQDLNARLARVAGDNWVSVSGAGAKAAYDRCAKDLAALHADLNRLAGALADAGVELSDVDKRVAGLFSQHA